MKRGREIAPPLLYEPDLPKSPRASLSYIPKMRSRPYHFPPEVLPQLRHCLQQFRVPDSAPQGG